MNNSLIIRNKSFYCMHNHVDKIYQNSSYDAVNSVQLKAT